MTADVLVPTVRNKQVIVNVAVSATDVPTPNVAAHLDVSAVDPAVPNLTVTTGDPVPAVFAISITHLYVVPATGRFDGNVTFDPVM
jgi:hypothetical protein